MKRFIVLAAVLAVIIVPVLVYMRISADTVPTVDYGPKTVEGLLTGTGISLIRKGTHILKADGMPIYFVSSDSVALERFEGQKVRLIGRVGPNVSPKYLPLFTVESLEPLEEQETTQEWSVPALGITLLAPTTWKATLVGGILMFKDANGSSPILVVKKYTGDLPAGDMVRISGKSGVRLRNGNSQKVFVVGSADTILLDFTPERGSDELGKLNGAFQRVLDSVHFVFRTSSSSVLTGTGGGICGGAAGILCPAGSFCEIKDSVMREGVCRKL